jgi:hypothetical protein
MGGVHIRSHGAVPPGNYPPAFPPDFPYLAHPW